MKAIALRIYSKCHQCPAAMPSDKKEARKAGWFFPVFIEQRDSTLQTQLCPECAPVNDMRRWTLQYGIRIGILSSYFAPGFGACDICKTNWYYIEHHTTMLPEGGGVFVLCEPCWSELTPEARLPHYENWFRSWEQPNLSWEMIREAVLNEDGEWPEVVVE